MAYNAFHILPHVHTLTSTPTALIPLTHSVAAALVSLLALVQTRHILPESLCTCCFSSLICFSVKGPHGSSPQLIWVITQVSPS